MVRGGDGERGGRGGTDAGIGPTCGPDDLHIFTNNHSE